MTLTILLLIATLSVFLVALVVLGQDLLENARIERLLRPHASEDASLIARSSRLDRAVLRTPVGERIDAALENANITTGPGRFVLVTAAVSLALAVFLGSALSWLLFPLGLALGLVAARVYLRREIDQRREAFIAQMPELARTLSNASSAGLSVRTAISLAAEEMDEPTKSELNEVSAQLAVGRSLDDALSAMERRIPSREVSVLVNSLVVSSRAGGALVGALREIAETLETRKELRREIRTTYAQTVATAYAVLGMGVLSLFLLERVNEGTIDAMLRSGLGQLVLIAAVVIYALGVWGVRRMTRTMV